MPGWLDTNPTLTGEQTRHRGPRARRQLRGPAPLGRRSPHRLPHVHAAPRAVPVRRLRPGAGHRPTRVETRTPGPGRRPPLAWRARMIIATAPFVAGYRVTETKGQVFGLVVRSRGLGGNFVAGLRSIVGGEIHEYTSLLEDTRRQAIDRMVQNATMVGANADHLVPVRLVGARRDDVRDRRLRHRRRHRPGVGRGADRAAARAGRHRRPDRVAPCRWSLVRILVGGIGVLLILAGIAVAATRRTRRQPVRGAVPVRPGRRDDRGGRSSSGPGTGRSTRSRPAPATGRAEARRSGPSTPGSAPRTSASSTPRPASRCRSGSTPRSGERRYVPVR